MKQEQTASVGMQRDVLPTCWLRNADISVAPNVNPNASTQLVMKQERVRDFVNQYKNNYKMT